MENSTTMFKYAFKDFSDYSILLTVLLMVTLFAGLFANATVMSIILTSKKLRTMTNFMILSISVSNLLIVIFVLPYSASIKFKPSSAYCQFAGYILTLSDGVIYWNLGAIWIRKMTAVVMPFLYNSNTKPSKWWTGGVILYIWIQAIIVSTIPFMGTEYERLHDNQICLFYTESANGFQAYVMIYYVIPVCSIFISGVSVILYSSKKHVVSKTLADPFFLMHAGAPKVILRPEPMRAFRTLIYVIIVLFFTKILYLIAILKLNFNQYSSAQYLSVAEFLSLLSCLTNPLIILTNKKFVQSLKDNLNVFCKKSKKRVIPEITTNQTDAVIISDINAINNFQSLKRRSSKPYILDKIANLYPSTSKSKSGGDNNNVKVEIVESPRSANSLTPPDPESGNALRSRSKSVSYSSDMVVPKPSLRMYLLSRSPSLITLAPPELENKIDNQANGGGHHHNHNDMNSSGNSKSEQGNHTIIVKEARS